MAVVIWVDSSLDAAEPIRRSTLYLRVGRSRPEGDRSLARQSVMQAGRRALKKRGATKRERMGSGESLSRTRFLSGSAPAVPGPVGMDTPVCRTGKPGVGDPHCSNSSLTLIY